VSLVTSAEEAAKLAGWVNLAAEKELAQLDYQRDLVIALFYAEGWTCVPDVVLS